MDTRTETDRQGKWGRTERDRQAGDDKGLEARPSRNGMRHEDRAD